MQKFKNAKLLFTITKSQNYQFFGKDQDHSYKSREHDTQNNGRQSWCHLGTFEKLQKTLLICKQWFRIKCWIGKSCKSLYLQPDDDRCCQIEFSGGLDDALGDDVTPHDATEDVDQNRVNL